jgi:predicted dienelactone hydrolase
MHTMIRGTLTCAMTFGFLSLVRTDPRVLGAALPNPPGTITLFDVGAQDISPDPGGGEDRREHPRLTFKVGHRVLEISVPYSVAGIPAGTPPTMAGSRLVDVHLWYPADLRDYFHAPVTEYSSALNGAPLPSLWDPLSWKVASLSAREGPSIHRGPKYPVIVFSHGNTNAPIDYAFTLEDIASAGFVVAAPTHVNNSQDDVRMDFVNTAAKNAGFPLPFACLDGLSSPCSHVNVPLNMADRVRDITFTLDALRAELENRVDLDRVGVLGHSRGTVTALTAAGGSTVWGVSAEPRVSAVMGLAIGAPAVTFSANIGAITQPTLLVSGSLDSTSPSSVSQTACELLPSTTEKAHVVITNAVHRTFDSTYCEQMQSAAAVAQGNSRAILDLHTASLILSAPLSRRAMDYCGLDSFVRPTDVRPFVKALTGFDVTEANVPTTGLTTAQLRPRISEMAITFFDHTIGRPGSRRHHLRDDFPIEWLVGQNSNQNRDEDRKEDDERHGCDPIPMSALK